MKTTHLWQNSFKVINSIGLLLIAVCFIFIHFNSKPAQTQLTYLPLLLPLFLLLPLRKVIYVNELKFLFFIALIFISSCISYGLQGDIFTQDFRSHWTYLLALGVFSVLVQKEISKNYFLGVFIIASMMVAYDVCIEYMNHAIRGAQTHGKPIFFGNIALTTGLVSFILSLDKANSWWVRGLLLLSAIAGVAGSIWSQTRGGWIFLMIFSIVFLCGAIINSRNKKKSTLLGSGLLIVLCLTALPFSKTIESRLGQAYLNIEAYFSGGNANTSVGLRLELWRVSIEQFSKNPIVGSARSDFLAIKEYMISDNTVASKASILEHAHSDLFWTLGTKGILGVVSFYALYLFLLRFYYLNLKNKEIRLYALSGLTVVFSYLVYGLSESFFSMKLGIGYFIIINLVLIRLISIHNRKNEKPLIVLCNN